MAENDWGYSGANGPSTWTEKFPEAGGARQSPVDIDTTKSSSGGSAPPLKFRYSVNHPRSIVNPGYCWRVDENGYDSELRGGPLGHDVYKLQQWHCHWGAVNGEGSEHTVDGRSFSGELHLVHWNTTKYNSFQEAAGQTDGLAVLGVLLMGNHGANLLRHFYSQHRAKYEEINNINSAAKDNMPPQSSNATKSVMQCCTRLVTDHGRPFSLIEDKAFKDLLMLIPGVTQNQQQAINVKNVRSSIQDMAHEIRLKICNEIKNNLLALKVDVASIKLRRFLGLNIQYVVDGKIVLRNISIIELHDRNTGQYLKDNVADCLSRYGIDLTQIQTITTDNGANMISMTNQINETASESISQSLTESDIEMDGEYNEEDSAFLQQSELEIGSGSTSGTARTVTSVRCAAHCLQLAIKDACQEIEEFLGHCRRIARNLRTPNMAMRLKLLKLQNAVIDTPIRWDSTADMLERLLILKDFCIANLNSEPEVIWDSIENYLNVLRPCRILSKKLQKEQLTFGDFYIAWMKCRFEVEQLHSSFARRLLSCLRSRQEVLFSNEYFIAAIYLDPRVNATLTTTQQNCARAVLVDTYKRLTNLKRRTTAEATLEPSSPGVNDSVVPGTSAELDSLNEDINFDSYLRQNFVTNRHINIDQQNLQSLEREINFKLVAFLQEPVLPTKSNILEYWEQKKMTDPYLYNLAKVVLATPPTSVSVERLFSSLKFVLNNLRMSLNDLIIDDVLVVRNNHLFSLE